MSTAEPLTVAEWREFLRGYSFEFLNSSFLRKSDAAGTGQRMLSKTQRGTGWLGYEPTREDAILTAEQRLGVRLPPSYRNFLLASNGWSVMSYIADLLNVEQIGRFGELEAELVAAWSDPGLEFFADHLNMLKRSILISDDGGGCGCYWVLSPDRVADDGEWTAYQWWPGDGEDPEPYRNFAVLVTSVRDAAIGQTVA